MVSISSCLEQTTCDMVNTLRTQVGNFLVEFRFLIMFHDMVKQLSSEVWVEFASPLPVIEAAVNKAAKELTIAGKVEKVSKLIVVFSNLLKKIELLKPLIEKSCNYFWKSRHFLEFGHQHGSWAVCGHWNMFLKSTGQNLQTLVRSDHSLLAQTEAFLEKLSSFTDFFIIISRSVPLKSDLRALRIHAGAVAIRAANLSCLCWLKLLEMYQSMAEEMGKAFSLLLHKLDPATPEFLGVMFPFLGVIYHYNIISPIDMYIHHLLHIKPEYALHSEIGDLIKSFNELQQVQKKDAEQLLPYMAAAFSQAAGYLTVMNSRSGKDETAVM